MPIDDSIAFDRNKDFGRFFDKEPVGAVKWLEAVFVASSTSGVFAESVRSWLRPQADLPAIEASRDSILAVGKALTTPFASFSLDAVQALGLSASATPAPLMLRGTVQVVATTKELGQRLVLAVGQREFPLVSNDDPLECFAGDLSAFAGNYEVAVVGWPDTAGQIHVQEAAPIMPLPGLSWSDWAQGRLFDNGVVDGPVVLRINAGRQVGIDDPAMQERLRSFIGTGVVLYGKRSTDANGRVSLTAINDEGWFLTRLTNPADAAANYPGAPRPTLVGDRCVCIGATPPWSWQGPNVETHIVAPVYAAALANTEERRVVFGRPAAELPSGIPNPIASVNRVILASACAEPQISSTAHIATRRAPRGTTVESIRGIVELTSAEQAFLRESG